MTIGADSPQEILKTIPHRDPFLFLKKINKIEEGKYLRATMKNDPNDYFYKGHFPSTPIMPGVLIIEALAQAACYHFVKTMNPLPGSIFFMGSVKIRFFKHANPGDIIDLEVDGEKIISSGALYSVKALSARDMLVSGQLGLICKSDRF